VKRSHYSNVERSKFFDAASITEPKTTCMPLLQPYIHGDEVKVDTISYSVYYFCSIFLMSSYKYAPKGDYTFESGESQVSADIRHSLQTNGGISYHPSRHQQKERC
jgi:hypothetical protein